MLFEGGIPFYGIMGLAVGAGIMVLLGTYQFRNAVV
jgi:ABC-2 type transport system permease protein